MQRYGYGFEMRRMRNFLILILILFSACGENQDLDDFIQAGEVARLDLVSLRITSESQLLSVGESVQFSANGHSDDNAVHVLTDRVDWSSADSTVAQIDQNGLLSARNNGVTTITARFADLSSSLDFIVNSANLVSIELSANSEVDECKSLDIDVAGVFDDGSKRNILEAISWQLSDTNIAQLEVSDTGAVLHSFDSGVLDLTATSDGISSTLAIQIRDNLIAIDISPQNPTISVANTTQFTTNGHYSDNATVNITSNTAWVSDNTEVATFSSTEPGLLTALTSGTANVTAACGAVMISTGFTAESTVLQSVRINSGKSKITLTVQDSGEQLTLFAINADGSESDVTEDADWSRLTPGSLQISINDNSGDKGILTITGSGNATIEATYKNLSDSVLIVVP